MKSLLCAIFLVMWGQAHTSTLRENVFALSGGQAEGRGPGSPGHDWALKLVKTKLRELGLAPQVQTVAGPYAVPIQNIYARLPGQAGADKNKSCLALVAHYDHIGANSEAVHPGAMDNAASVALLLDVARLLKQRPLPLKSDVYFIFPDYEERNLQGSFFFLPHLKTLCQDIRWNITLDVLGAPFFRGMEKQLLVFGSESSRSWQKILPQNLSTLGIHQGPIYLIEPFEIPRSDYANFRLHHIPFLFLTNGTPWNYHTPWDTPERLDYEHLQEVSSYLYQILQNYSQLEDKLSFRYNFLSPARFRQSAARVAELLRRYLQHRQENHLSTEEVAHFERSLKVLALPTIGRAQLNAIVISLLQSISSKQDVFRPQE